MNEPAVALTVADGLRDGSARLAQAGVDTPRLDAELLLAEALGCDRAALVLRATECVPAAALQRFEGLLARRAAREPVAYILGRRAFRRLTLSVDRRVLIPRPETELLVDVGLTLPFGARVLDVGTGSGAVALALKDERRDLELTGTDVSVRALAVARANAVRLGLHVRFVLGDLLAGVRAEAVLANLPYVAAGDPSLPPEVALYEPADALFAGPGGLRQIRRLIGSLSGVSVVGLEVGLGQAEEVARLVSGAGFGRVERLRDLAGIERVVVGRR